MESQDLAKRIEQLEGMFVYCDLEGAKKELEEITAYMRDSGLFPERQVLVRTPNGWAVEYRNLMLVAAKDRELDSIYLSDDGRLYKTAHIPLSLEEHRNLHSNYWILPQWSTRYEAGDEAYRAYGQNIAGFLRGLAKGSLPP